MPVNLIQFVDFSAYYAHCAVRKSNARTVIQRHPYQALGSENVRAEPRAGKFHLKFPGALGAAGKTRKAKFIHVASHSTVE